MPNSRSDYWSHQYAPDLTRAQHILARILTFGIDNDYIVSVNSTKPLLIYRVLPHFEIERTNVNYGGPYRKSNF